MTPIEVIKAAMKNLDELGRCHGLVGFLDAPRGHKQESEIDGVKWEWCEQFGPGICGDDFHGSVFVEVEPGCFAEFEYST